MRTASAPSAGKGFCYCSHPRMLDIPRLTRCLKVVSVSRMRSRVSEQRGCLDGPHSWIELCVCENLLVVLFLLNMEHQLTPQYIRHHVCRAAGPPESEHPHCQPCSTSTSVHAIPLAHLSSLVPSAHKPIRQVYPPRSHATAKRITDTLI